MKITDYQDEKTLQEIKEFESIPAMWENSVTQYADMSAIKDGDKTYTYRELDEAVCRFRGHLFEKGYRQGGEIRLASQRSYGFVKAFLAAETLGLTVTVLPEGHTENAMTPEEYSIDYPCTDTEICRPESEASAVIIYTGGTTGMPKGAILSHRCVMVSVRNACYGYPNVFRQKYLHVLPMHHVFGLIRSMLTCLATGSELILCPDPKKMFDTAMAENPTISILVPLLVDRGITMSRRFGRSLFGNSMQTIITGAAPVAEHLAKDCLELGITLCPGYGLTETACLVSGNPDMAGHPDSVGLLYPDQEVRFVEGELQIRGRNIMTGYVSNAASRTEDSIQKEGFTPDGSLVQKEGFTPDGSLVQKEGFTSDGSLTQKAGFTPDGWFATGDIGYLDEDGFLYLLGRKKEMLLTANGENVYPAPVEAKFNSIPEVAESELFEGDDGRLHIEIFPRNPEKYSSPEDTATTELLVKLSAVNAGLPKHEQASSITLRMTDFPRTKSLKMVRRGNIHGQV